MFQVPRATDGGQLRPKRLRDLHREGTYSSGGAVDQNLLSRLNVSLVAKTLQRGKSGHCDRGRLLEGDVIRLRHQCSLRSTDILRYRSISRAENFIAWFELGDIFPHRLHRARAIDPEA